MKPDYKNWVPKTMVVGLVCATVFFCAGMLLFAATNLIASSVWKWILIAVFTVCFILCGVYSIWAIYAYSAFSYSGKKQLSKKIVNGVAEYISTPKGARILDVGCGSGALTIACAKRNPDSTVTGIDRWGKEYASFNKRLCEDNAQAEGVSNTEFCAGDAVKPDFPDESFDAVTSNYVYHNIAGKDKQTLLLETLRVLKKGGTFAIHDLMSPRRYGDMRSFTQQLKEQGYASIELIDTTDGKFMSRKEARLLMLDGSTILRGVK